MSKAAAKGGKVVAKAVESGARVIATVIRLTVKAGQAKPSPPVGPALGQHGLNLMSFCKEFNARTAHLKEDVPVPCRVVAYTDKTFEFTTKSPAVSYFLKKAAGLESGSGRTGHEYLGTVSLKHVYEIAKIKQQDPLRQYISLEAHCKEVMGTCRSMGIRVLDQGEGEALEAAGAAAPAAEATEVADGDAKGTGKGGKAGGKK